MPPDNQVFICESTGDTFTVDLNKSANAAYLVEGGEAAPCKFDDKNDAYLAIQDEATGKWRKAPRVGG